MKMHDVSVNSDSKIVKNIYNCIIVININKHMLAKTWLNEIKYQRFASNISKRDEYLPQVKEVSEVKTKIDSNASIFWKEY